MAAAVKEAVGRWTPMLEDALRYDKWGQVVEAVELYTAIHREVGSLLKGVKEMPAGQRNAILRLQAVMQMRLTETQKMTGGHVGASEQGIGHEEVAKIADLRPLIMENAPWPIPLETVIIDETDPGDDQAEDEQLGFNGGDSGHLIPAPRLSPGDRILKIEIEKIGLKDAMEYLDPFITVSVRAGPYERQLLETEQHTPHPRLKREVQAVHFMTAVYIQTPLDKLSPQANIFMEFKHYKPKKNKISVRCWSMLSQHELVEGPRQLEIYAKPADFTAKKFHKHSNKPLFMHVNLSIMSNQR